MGWIKELRGHLVIFEGTVDVSKSFYHSWSTSKYKRFFLKQHCFP